MHFNLLLRALHSAKFLAISIGDERKNPVPFSPPNSWEGCLRERVKENIGKMTAMDVDPAQS